MGEALKMLDLTLQDMTMTDQIAGVENARPDNDRPIIKTEVWKTDGGKGSEESAEAETCFIGFNSLMDTRSYSSATSNNMKSVHWPLIGGLLHLVQRGGD